MSYFRDCVIYISFIYIYIYEINWKIFYLGYSIFLKIIMIKKLRLHINVIPLLWIHFTPKMTLAAIYSWNIPFCKAFKTVGTNSL